MMTFGSLFAGIGGFDLGLERAGMTCKWQVEINPYCQKVLAKHWPNVRRYGDIRTIGIDLESVDLICGGFPCQPFSQAGKRKGKEDDRYLWPEMLRVIAQKGPAWVVGENVTGIIGLALDRVLLDLENEGYATRTFVIPACAVDAKHRRDRVWIIANRTDSRAESLCRRQDSVLETGIMGHAERELMADAPSARWRPTWGASEAIREPRAEQRLTGCGSFYAGSNSQSSGRPTKSRQEYCEWLPEPELGRVANGIPHRLDRLRALGNAVVPQVVEVIGRAIMEAHHV